MKTYRKRAAAWLVVFCLLASIIPAPANFAKAVELGSVELALADYASGRVAVKTDVNTRLVIKDASDALVDAGDVDISYAVDPSTAATVDSATGIISTLEEGDATVTVTVTPKAGGAALTDSITLDIQESSENLFAAGDFENAASDVFNRASSNWRKLSVETAARGEDTDNKAYRIFMDKEQISESGYKSADGKIPNAGNIFLKSGIPVYPGKLYQMSFLVKTADFSNANSINLAVDMYYSVKQDTFTGKYNDNGGVITGANRNMSIVLGDNDWTPVTLWICAPLPSDVQTYMDNSGKVYVSPYITARAKENGKTPLNELGIGGTVYIDDIEIREVGFDSVDVQMGAVNEETDGTTAITVTPIATTGEKIGIRKADFITVYEADSTNSNVIDVSKTVSGLSGNANGLAAAKGTIVTKGYGDTKVTISCTLNGITRTAEIPVSLKEKMQVPKSATLELSEYESRVAVKTKVNTNLIVLDTAGANIPKSKFNVSYEVEPSTAATVDSATGVVSALEKGPATIKATVTDANGENPVYASMDIEIAESSDNLFEAGDFEDIDYTKTFKRPASSTGGWRTYNIDTVKDRNGNDTKVLGIHFDGTKASEEAQHNWINNGIKIKPGRLYQMSFWAKTENFENASGITFLTNLPYSTASTEFASSNSISTAGRSYNLPKTDTEWQKHTLWIAAPVEHTAEDLYVYLYFTTTDSTVKTGINGDCYIDDVEIREVGFDRIDYTVGDLAQEYLGTTEISLLPIATTGAKIGVRAEELPSVYAIESADEIIDASAFASGLTGNKNGLGGAVGSVVTKGIGNATVTVSCTLNGVKRTVDIPLDMTHIPNAIHEVNFSYEKDELIVGEKFTPTISATMLDGSDVDLENAQITYATSNPNVVAINSNNGMIAAIGEGKATITAKVIYNDITVNGTFDIVSIDPGELASVEISAPKTSISRGEEVQLALSGMTTNGTKVAGENLDASYEVVEGSQYASVDAASGLVTGIESGVARIRATASLRGGESKTNEIEITVNDKVEYAIEYIFYEGKSGGENRTVYQASNWSTNNECSDVVNLSAGNRINNQGIGIQILTTGAKQWVTFRINVDREGWYTPSLSVWAKYPGGIFRSYISKPAAAAGEITTGQLEALRNKENSIGVMSCYVGGTSAVADFDTVKMRTVYFPEPGEYAITMESESPGGDNGYRIFPAKLTLNRVAFAEASAEEALPDMDLASIIPAAQRWAQIGESKSFEMLPSMEDGSYEDLIAAESVTAVSSDESKLKAEIETDANGFRTLKLTGLEKAADPTVTLTVKLNGVTYTETLNIPVTVGQRFDFKNYNNTGDETKTPADAQIAVDGWQVSSERALSYNAESGIVAETSGVGQDVNFKVNLEDSGWHQLTLGGGKYADGGIAGVYIDGYYVGEYDFYGDEVVGDGELMRALNLSEGEHTVTLRTVGTSGSGYKMHIGSFDFVALTQTPELTKIIANTSGDDIPAGSSANIKVIGIWADGAEHELLPKLDGSADETYTIAYISSNPNVATVENGMWYAHEVGDSNIQITVTTASGNKEIVLPVAVNDKAWAPDKTKIVLDGKLYEDATVIAHIRAFLGDGNEVDESALTVNYRSGNTDVFTVAENVLTGVAKGEATLFATVSYSGAEEEFELPVKVLPKGFAEVTVSAENTYVNTGVEVALIVTAKTNTGEAQDLSGASFVYESLTPNIASVSQDGIVTTLAEGNAKIKVTVTVGEGEEAITNAGEINIGVTNGKTWRSYYTDEKVENARENITKYTWARKSKNTAVANADKYVAMGLDRLWEMVPGEGLARSWMIGYINDPMGYHCPHPDCGVDLRAEYSTYPWIMDPINKPWKITCPNCRKQFPTNDFAKFYELGLDEHGVFDIDLAHTRNDELIAKGEKGYLVNELYPELGEDWGVDDGLGWKTGKYNGTVEECKTFIGYYIGRGLWVDNGILTALTALRDAYLYTGEAKYGRAGAILVDRIADLFPDFHLIEQSNQWWLSHGGTASNGNHICLGKIEGRIQDCATAREFVYAYDAFFPAMEDAQVIDFLSKKAEKYKLDNKKKDAYSIRQNCEDGILREVYESCKTGEIYGNFGMHQATLGIAAIVLDRMPETGEWIDYIMQPGVYTKPVMSNEKDENGNFTGEVITPGSVNGGNVENQLVDYMLRDGSYSEAAPGYNKTDLTYYCLLVEALNGYDKYEGADLYEHPATIAWFKSFAPLVLVGQSLAELADTGVVQTKGVIIEASGTRKAFEITGDPELAQLLYARYKSEGADINTIHSDIWTKNPEKVKDDMLKVIEEYGEFSRESEMANGIGFAILRDGKTYDASIAANSINNQRDFWLYYGTTRGVASHGHAGVLNLGIEAYGLNMAPELGYPEATGSSPHRVQWTRTTLSHNTVVVNEEPQARNDTFSTGTPLHFDDVGRVKLMDIDAWNAYPKSTDIYRRTVVMIEASDEVSYGLDFFRVKGGNDHIYSFHSLSDTVSGYSGVDFTEQKMPVVTDSGEVETQWAGSYAGADIPWGIDENDPNSADVLAKRGYTWLGQVRKDTTVNDKFNIDFKVTDFRKILPYTLDLHMNVTMLNRDLDEVTLATSIPPQRENNPKNLEYMLARRSGSNLDTLFTAAYEPYNGERYLSDIAAATQVETAGMPFVEIDEGTEGADDKVQVVRVTFKNGRVDYVIYATNNQVKYTVYEVEEGESGLEKIPLFDFRGFVGVYTVADGRNTFSYVNDGDLIAGYETTAAYTGSVVDFSRELLFEHDITVRFDVGQDVNPEALVGRDIYIENDGPENAVYNIKGAKKDGRNIILNIGADRLVTKYKDANDTSKGYVYNIDTGAAFRIPLSLANNTAPIFDAVGEQKATAGKKYSLKVNATSPIGEELTYSPNVLPRGASFDAANATINWTPDVNQVGVHNFAIDVTDGGSISTLRFEIEVYKSTGSVTGGNSPSAPPAVDDNPSTPSGGGGGGGGSSSGGSSDTTEPEDTTKPEDSTDTETEDNTGGGSATVEKFVDLENHDWAKDAIYALVEKGVINGTSANTYSPAKKINRADFAIMLVRAFGVTEGDGEHFADVDANKYYAEELRLAKSNGIVGGIGNNKFNPEGEITRQDMMVMLYRALKAVGKELSAADESVLAQFVDAAEISDYAREAVAQLVGAGAIAGSNGRINPTGRATRAEVAVMLNRIFA